MNSEGRLIVISGPSGSGKGTVIKKLMETDGNLFYSVSATTREPREGEIDGKNYFFLTKEEFKKQIENGRMLEYAEYCGNFYGTPKTAVDDMLALGRDVILEIEVKGAMNVKRLCPGCVSIFLMPPSEAELEARLRGRGTEDDAVIQGRLNKAKKEMSLAGQYDYVVVNDVIDEAARKIGCIITAEKLKVSSAMR